MNSGQRRCDLRRLVDALPEDKIEAARRLLEILLVESGELLPEGLVERLSLIERIVDFLPDGVLTVDREGRVVVWNRAVEEMTGVRKEEVLGRGEYAYAVPFYGERRPILVNILLGNGKEWEQKYEKIERKGQVLIGEGFAPCAYGGRGLHFWTLAAPICDEEGNLLGAIQCVRDIGERKKMEDELRHWSTLDALTGLYNCAFLRRSCGGWRKVAPFP
ncbi:MAG: PAS domain-containing protein [Desulfotomaculales bacterium]